MDHSLTAAAAYYVHDNRIEEFRPRLSELHSNTDSGLVRETSRIALQRWDSPAALPTVGEASIEVEVTR